MIGQAVTFDDVGMVDIAEDLDLAPHLEANGVLVVAVNHFQSIELAGRTVEDLVDRAAAPTADAIDALELREVERSRGIRRGRRHGGGGRGGGGRERKRYG
ncbi:unnamed protein product [Cuscuta epithymum]|uniref:Uncharacterized protein n=1 Tax=Cuscuta epithymum TaxID=186058 RepID=A0AAV0D3Y3_9ASTE|nr:unnamed protein product [Cuscuta epithymum]